MEEPDDDDVPEAIKLHAALAVAVLALELIRDIGDSGGSMAAAALGHLRRRHPISEPHFTPEKKSREDPGAG